MGVMCELEGNYHLAYDLYSMASTFFLIDSDTLSYFYAKSDMAISKAFLREKEICMQILKDIESQYSKEHIIHRTIETKALCYRYCEDFDSVIIMLDSLQNMVSLNTNCLMLKAQAYSMLGRKDSALVYAHEVLKHNCSVNDSLNAFYILSNDDQSLLRDRIKSLTSKRSDLQVLMQNRQKRLSHAVEILQQDLSRKPNYYRWIIVLILLICTCMGICYIILQHRRGTLLSFYSKRIANENKELSEQNQQLYKQREQQVLHACETLCSSPNWKNLISWNDYAQMCDNVDLQFFRLATKLQQKNILNEKELRLCILVLLDIPHREIANILTYSESGIGKYKYSIAKKLGVNSKNLRTFLMDLAVKM